ncbi:MAG: radical SAM protein [Coriobacteriales bacterium]|nr:radical SAM protein [Coriobacteriales bacterium]
MSTAALKVALIGVNSPGYRSLALGFLRAHAQADPRLSDVGFQTLDLDTDADPWWIAWRVLALDPEVVALSVTCWNARIVYEVARIVRAAKPNASILLGGPEVGPIAEDVLRAHPNVDAVVRGEGEITFADLLVALKDGAEPADVPGVTARRDGGVASAPDRPLIEDLDNVPSPYLSGVLEPVDGSTYLETYRGCPHRCAYCFEGKGYGRLRRFSEARVAAEIDFVATSEGVRSFSFIDPVFNLTPKRLKWLAEHLEPYAASGIRLHTVEVDIESIDERSASELKRCGVASVETGPQTVGTRALQTCHRDFDRAAFAAGVAACRSQGIRVETDLIIGMPGDTAADVLSGIDFTISLDPGTVQLSTLHVLPGTELWNSAAELDLRFDPEPPHEVIATGEMDYLELRRLEVLGNAMVSVYAARVPHIGTGGALA